MNKTKIDWCDSTWNPVTGCNHACEYCYARRMVKRFSTQSAKPDGEIHCLNKRADTIYPFGFDPTFHKYRLDEPAQKTKPQNIFVGSMADLFGEWVPDEWIEEVFEACKKAPQHRYLFLTKNPQRYYEMQEAIYDLVGWQYSPEAWFGMTITGIDNTFSSSLHEKVKCFLSIEPLLQQINWIDLCGIEWVIVGAETGNRKDKVIPKREWIENIAEQCQKHDVPLFMKSSLADIWGDDLIQEYPW